jgi:predicted tellurium resistance membrane protein TerC
MNKLIDYLRERLPNVVKTCYGILALVMVSSLIVDSSHAHTWVEKYIPFFWSFFGFGAAAVIIGFARWFGHSGIMTRPDYYDRDAECNCTCTTTKSSGEHA